LRLPTSVKIVSTVDWGGMLLLSSLALWLYPLRIALPLSLLLLGVTWSLTSKLIAGRTSGYYLQLGLFFAATSSLAYRWAPFGLLIPGGLLFAWADPTVRVHFGMETNSSSEHVPLLAALAIQLIVVQWGWLLLLSHHLFLGGKLGVLEVLSGGRSQPVLLGSLLFLLLAIGLRHPLGYLAAPWVLTPVVLSVYPLGWILLPLYFLWLLPRVVRWFGVFPLGLLRSLWVMTPMILGLALLAGWISPGVCPRDGFPLRLTAYWQSPLFRGGEPQQREMKRSWDIVRVYCPVDDLALLYREQQRLCHTQRRLQHHQESWPENLLCPFDQKLRESLPAFSLPKNRFEPSGPMGSRTWVCVTCKQFGLARP
jgi:hypothetical protein